MVKKMINKSFFEEAFSGFQIYDCAVRARKAYSFSLVELSEINEKEKRIVTYFQDDNDGNWQGYFGFAGLNLACAKFPSEQAVMVARDGSVAVLGSGVSDMEKSIESNAPSTPIYTSVHGLATIEGYVYATGPWRAVCRRVAANKWEFVGDRNTLPVPKRNSSGSNNQGFDAIAGFNASDIYCVGGHGDAWRFNGTSWRQCALPTNMTLENVCCAGDGYVYIGMQSGSVMRGREDYWEMIHKGSFTIPFKDMVWYQDRVWCTSDYGVWQIVDGKVIEADIPAEIRGCGGNLSVGDGVMLMAGMYGAAVFDGKKWERLK